MAIGDQTRRHDGQHVYLRSALNGAVLFLAALVIRQLLLFYCKRYLAIDNFLVDLIRPLMKEHDATVAGVVVTALYSLVLGKPIALALNNFPQAHQRAFAKTASELDLLLLRAQQSDRPASVTLDNGTVYVGMVIKTTDPDRTPTTITLLPILSGQRDDKGNVTFTTDYLRIYTELKDNAKRLSLGLPERWVSTFELVIRAERIVTASIFSPQVYADFNPAWQDALRPSGKLGEATASANGDG